MSDTMRILSRDAFAEVLDEARVQTAERPADWPLIAQIDAQLRFLARATASGRVPSETDRSSISLGILAARNLEETDAAYADALAELDYTFRRYPQLPAGPPARRRGVLQVWSGRHAFRKIVLDLGVSTAVSNGGVPYTSEPPADVPHFQIVWDGVSAHVHAVGRHRLTVSGRPTWYGEMANRGWMTAGTTFFRFLVEDRTPPPKPFVRVSVADAALAELDPHCNAGRLYAVIDAARAPRAVQLLEESVDPYNSLYDGEAGRAHDDVAPYLVQLRSDSWLLERLVREGFGDAWGIYLVSDAGFDAVRRHLRQFLMVEAEGEERRLFFRFYDPRVLRTFAEVITPEQRNEFMKDLDVILYEVQDRLSRLTQ
jgi:hypothetical protein